VPFAASPLAAYRRGMYPDATSFLTAERRAWRPFEALDGLSDDQLSRPLEGAHGWSGRDLMAHFIFWHERSVIIAGELAIAESSTSKARDDAEWDARGGDAVNDEAQANWARLPIAEVRVRFRTVFEALRVELAHVPASRWAASPDYTTWFVDVTIDHYERHASDLAAVLASAA
jgi:hypothetical protein